MPAANLHLTLAFLGDTAPERLAELVCLCEWAARHPAMRLRCDRLGSWGPIGWLAPSRPHAPLLRWVGALHAALAAHDFPIDGKRYRPHLTLLRQQRQPLSGNLRPPLQLAIDHLALVASETTASGPRYRELQRWALAQR